MFIYIIILWIYNIYIYTYGGGYSGGRRGAHVRVPCYHGTCSPLFYRGSQYLTGFKTVQGSLLLQEVCQSHQGQLQCKQFFRGWREGENNLVEWKNEFVWCHNISRWGYMFDQSAAVNYIHTYCQQCAYGIYITSYTSQRCIYTYMYTYIYIHIQVVPGRAGGGSFRRKRTI